jgi:DNA processing protein
VSPSRGPVQVTALDAAYPLRLRSLKGAPPSITVQGGPVEAKCAVAIVGSRRATVEALAFAGELAASVAHAGAVVVSGGAEGIDAAAHEAALRIGGRTWAVAGTGHLHCYPREHASLFERIARGPGAMVWPLAPDFHHRSGFSFRNRVLVALSDAVVVVQAGERSGALHAAGCAIKLGKPLWAVPAAPWMGDDFAGSRQLLAHGARPLTRIEELLGSLSPGSLGRCATPVPAPACPIHHLTAEARAVLNATPTTPSHLDSIAAAAGLTAQSAVVVLLTLALENVVVEGPPGFFRRTNAPNI